MYKSCRFIHKNLIEYRGRSTCTRLYPCGSQPPQVISTHTFITGSSLSIVYPKTYAHGFCFAVLCCGYTLAIFPYPSGLLHWHCGNLTIAPVPAKQPWWILINTSCEFIMNDCITTTKQSTTKPCAYFFGYTVSDVLVELWTNCEIYLQVPGYHNNFKMYLVPKCIPFWTYQANLTSWPYSPYQ